MSLVVDGRLNVEAVRSHFPALEQSQVFFDNAGGSQILGDAINSYVHTPTGSLHCSIDGNNVLILDIPVFGRTSKRAMSSWALPTMSAKGRQPSTTRVSKQRPIS